VIARVAPKVWGHEEVWAETERYTGKSLHFDKGAWASEHYHRFKHESWIVLSGKFEVTLDGMKHLLGPGDTLDVKPRSVHRVHCLEAGTIFEASTPHDDKDVIRQIPSEAGERAVP
jgi:quercetin dioxygenase-like cupin family protein